MAQESWKMEQEETACQQPPEGPILCTNNCGFFGSPTTGNMCSKCYRDMVLTQSNAKAAEKQVALATSAMPEIQQAPDVAQPSDTHMAETLLQAMPAADEGPSQGGATASEEPPRGPSAPPNRCFACKKRVGLTGFKCRCDHVFCSLHRYSEKHNCTYDYKAAGRDTIAKANPIVKADKVGKI